MNKFCLVAHVYFCIRALHILKVRKYVFKTRCSCSCPQFSREMPELADTVEAVCGKILLINVDRVHTRVAKRKEMFKFRKNYGYKLRKVVYFIL